MEDIRLIRPVSGLAVCQGETVDMPDILAGVDSGVKKRAKSADIERLSADFDGTCSQMTQSVRGAEGSYCDMR
jgi:hypothetical protein